MVSPATAFTRYTAGGNFYIHLYCAVYFKDGDSC